MLFQSNTISVFQSRTFPGVVLALLLAGLLHVIPGPNRILHAEDFKLSNAEGNSPVQYNRDVRAILTDNCFACHGLDAESREGDLRLDERSFAIESDAIVPNHPDQSELIARITATDPDVVMPPPETGHKLTNKQISILKSWIESGAEYQQHWSFIAPHKVTLPS